MNEQGNMSSSRPYLIRALHEWISDNQFTPYLLVDAEQDDVSVPRQFVQDGKIVLNISWDAVRELNIGNDGIEFNARFSGSPMHVTVPINAALAIYARENGQGMVFVAEGDDDQPPPDNNPEGSGNGPESGGDKKKPQLKLVK